MRKKDIVLPQYGKAVIRRIGAGAKLAYDELREVHVPPNVALLARLQEQGMSIDDIIGNDATGDTASSLVAFRAVKMKADRRARIFYVCACTVEPKITPETVDDVLDVDDFDDLEKAIEELNAKEDADLVPFDATRTS